MGIEVIVEGLTKSFGKQTVWQDVTLTLPPGEVSVMLGPSGTGKTVFLKSVIGLLKPELPERADPHSRTSTLKLHAGLAKHSYSSSQFLPNSHIVITCAVCRTWLVA